MVITFCGHSDFSKSEEYEIKLINLLEKFCKQHQVDFYLGDYGKFDAFAYCCAKKIKEMQPKTKLYFVSPYLNNNFRKLLMAKNKFDEIIYPALENVPPKFAILKRNEWMVEKSDVIIAFVNRNFGGAIKMLSFAKKKKKKIINLA